MSQRRLVSLIVAATAMLSSLSADATVTEGVTLTGHTGAVTSVAFSPDGTKVLTGSDDQTAILWDPVYAAPLLTYTGHVGPVKSVAFSPDGTKVFTGSEDRTAKLWDPIFGFCLHTFTGHTGFVYSVAFSADGTKLFTGSGDRSAILWDVVYRTATRTFTGHTQPISSVALTTDKTKLLTGSLDKTAILWNAMSGAVTRTFTGHTEAVNSVAFSPDGTRVLTGSSDDTAILWDTSTGEVIRTFTGHTEAVNSVAFSPDGAKILTGSSDKTAILWEASTGATIHTFAEHTDAVTSVAISPDGTCVLTGSADNTAKLWPLSLSVPDVTGKTQTAAETALVAAHLALGTVTEACSDTVAAGRAVRQDPAAGEMAAFGSAVNVTLSTGVCDVLVPGVVGQTQATASTAITDARLTVGTITEQYGTAVLIGSVVSQSPPEGVAVAPGTAVALVISSGPHHIMPNLVGLDQAAAALAGVGMTIGAVIKEGSNTVPAGTVINQYPVAGTSVSSETPVRVAISSGCSNVSVIPNQFGYGVLSSNVVYSPDGTSFLTGSGDGNARTWDSTTGIETHIYIGHTGQINAVAFSSDGSRVFTGSDDSTAKLWDTVTQAELFTFAGHGALISSVAFSPDGTKALTGSYDHTAKLWDTATGAEIRTFTGHTDIITDVAYSPDGTQVLTGSADNTARLWDAATGAEIGTFGFTNVHGLAFSHDGTRILTGDVLWDIASGVAVDKFGTTSTGDRIVSSALSPDDTLILAVTNKGSILLLPPCSGGQWSNQLALFQDAVATFSPDGTKVLAVTRWDNNLKLWDIASGDLRVFCGYTDAVNSAVLSPDGTNVFTGSVYAATLWDTATNAEIRNFAAPGYHMGFATQYYGNYSVAFSPDGTGLLAGSDDGIARLWDTASGTKLQTFTGHSAAITSVAFSPDGAKTLTGSKDGTARLWDATSGQTIHTLNGHANAVTSVDYSPGGSFVLTGSADQTAKLWDPSTGTLIQTFAGSTSTVTSVAFSPDEATILTGEADATATLWDRATGTVSRTFTGHTSAVTSVAYSPNGATVITGSSDNTAKLWDAKSGAQIGTLAGHRSAVLSVSFSLDGTKALTGSGDGTAKLWPLTLVPNVVGQIQEDVPPAFSAVGLAVGTITEAYSTTVAAGHVISQSPGAGTSVNPGCAIDLTVSKGTQVPNVMGQAQATALTAITNAGLAAGLITEEFSVTAAIGNVIGQSPEPDVVVNPGTDVDLTVSKGTQVPDVAGQTQAAASAAIADAGLAVGAVTQQYGTTVAWGHVISQSPLPAVCLDPGSAVAFVISSGPYNVTPDVVGQPQAAATTAITDVGLAVSEITQEYSPIVPSGNVINQSPMAGTVVNPGTAVALIVSKGQQPITVPDVVGMTRTAASAAITGAGLTVGTITEEYSPTVPSGELISQSPVTGTSVSPGTAVAFSVSKGPQPVTVPSVVGQTQVAASTALTAVGLTVGTITEEYNSTIPSGIVTSQSPLADISVNPGSAVALTVSKGPQPVTVPNVTDLAQAAASTALTAVGLAVGTITEEYSSTVASGNVVSQFPEADSSVSPGTAVALTVSKGPRPATEVPDVTGQTEMAAETTLTDANFTIGTATQQCSDTVAEGLVVSQDPAAGELAQSGSVVTLTVSTGTCDPLVPSVVGHTQAAASAAITGAGFTVGTITQQFGTPMPFGSVVSQLPAAGDAVAPGTAVALVISTGPYAITPDVLGQTQETASTAIASVGLTTGTLTLEYSSTVPSGSVIGQSPVAGTSVGTGTAVSLTLSRGPQPVATVPDVTGHTQTEASTAITGAGLAVGTITQEYSSAVPSGNVISQSPVAGGSVSPGTTVALTISKGPQPVAVPNVVGLTQATAATAITGAGLTAGTITQEYSSTLPSGSVISQNPAAGGSVDPGTAVALTVSKGPKPVSVPNGVGQTQGEAAAAITAAGLTIGTVMQEYSSTVPSGTVVSQFPVAGTSVSPGAVVALTVSKGAQPATVPNLVNQTQAAATMMLTGANLAIGTVTQQCSNTVAAGLVVSQSPAAGIQMASGSAVALAISTGQCESSAPTEAAFRDLLTQSLNTLDGNGDGQVSYAEALAALPGLTEAVFTAVDADGDGQISRSEAGLDQSGCGGCAGGKGSFTMDKMKKAFGNIFLAGLSLGVLSLLSRGRLS